MRLETLLLVVLSATQTLGCARHEDTDGGQILFGRKRFNELPWDGGDGAVFVSGTVTGNGVAYESNTVGVYCTRRAMECLIIDVWQVGPKQVGDLNVPLSYRVIMWDADIVVASSEALFPCRRETISLVRKTKTVVWVNEPINQSDAACADVDSEVNKWTVEDSPGWSAMLASPQ